MLRRLNHWVKVHSSLIFNHYNIRIEIENFEFIQVSIDLLAFSYKRNLRYLKYFLRFHSDDTASGLLILEVQQFFGIIGIKLLFDLFCEAIVKNILPTTF